MAKMLKNEVLLEAKGLSKTYTQTSGFFVKKQRVIKALNKVSISIKKGETLAIVGESGSGKSTLARCLLQLLSLDQGELFFKGKNLTTLDENGKMTEEQMAIAMASTNEEAKKLVLQQQQASAQEKMHKQYIGERFILLSAITFLEYLNFNSGGS
jgi:ABC-type oligopeptide transport system ATPase subunit